jgi:hypothetical protein
MSVPRPRPPAFCPLPLGGLAATLGIAWIASTAATAAATTIPAAAAWADVVRLVAGMSIAAVLAVIAQRRLVTRRTVLDDSDRQRVRRESRLPPTLEQQRALAAIGPVRGVWTRASAARYLARHAAERAALEAREWAARWSEFGVHMEQPEYMPADDRAAFDEACRACFGQGLEFPLAPQLDPRQLRAETALLRLAAGFFTHLESAQRRLVANGTLRHALDRPTLRRVFPDYALLLWVYPPAVQDPMIELALLHRARPTVLADESRGFELAAFLRGVLAAAMSEPDAGGPEDREQGAGAG